LVSLSFLPPLYFLPRLTLFPLLPTPLTNFQLPFHPLADINKGTKTVLTAGVTNILLSSARFGFTLIKTPNVVIQSRDKRRIWRRERKRRY
jgi:hypothetical protein